MATYPVSVQARDRRGRIVTLHRLGGGEVALDDAGADYYPTVLWYVATERNRRYFHPGEWANAWHVRGLGATGPDADGPYKPLKINEIRTSVDPLGAANTWPNGNTCTECGREHPTADLASACCTWQGGGTPTERAAAVAARNRPWPCPACGQPVDLVTRACECASEDPGGYIAEAKRDDAADRGRWEAYTAPRPTRAQLVKLARMLR